MENRFWRSVETLRKRWDTTWDDLEMAALLLQRCMAGTQKVTH